MRVLEAGVQIHPRHSQLRADYIGSRILAGHTDSYGTRKSVLDEIELLLTLRRPSPAIWQEALSWVRTESNLPPEKVRRLEATLAPLVRSTIFSQHIRHYFKLGSTNITAMQAASEGASEGTVFLAEQQTAGKGRGGHTWHSADSAGIYCSVILRPVLPPAEVVILSLAAALAVQSAVQAHDSKQATDLKWPNDLLIGGKKFCGILTEMNAEATRVRYIVIGIGINVNHQDFPAELQPVATSLRLASGKEWSRVELCAALLKSLDREYSQLLEDPDARQSILLRFAKGSTWVQGKKVRIEENGSAFEGTTEGLDPRGFLQVRTPHGLQTVLSGTVREK
jgi:BirA family biotin operon repressor/biotin-[acetyl-CoA-carboxylase] ligase